MSIAYKRNGTWVTASGTPPIDDALSATSENAVQNKIVKAAIENSASTLQQNFQAGVDDVYDAVVAKGSTPASKSLSDVVQGIADIPSEKKHISTSCKSFIVRKGVNFSNKTWYGLTQFYGSDIWTDGNNIYYSSNDDQYVLNKATSTWVAKTWSGYKPSRGDAIWSDGTNIYFSNNQYQYVLNKATSTWVAKTWSGLTSFNGYQIWSDGTNIYYTDSSLGNYVLNKSTSTWTTKTWGGMTPKYYFDIWTDGSSIYYNYNYRLNGSNWVSVSFSGLTGFSPMMIWSDGFNIYCTQNNSHYRLDSIYNRRWVTDNITNPSGTRPPYGRNYLWSDGTNIYYSGGSTQYVLNTSLTSVGLGT